MTWGELDKGDIMSADIDDPNENLWLVVKRGKASTTHTSFIVLNLYTGQQEEFVRRTDSRIQLLTVYTREDGS